MLEGLLELFKGAGNRLEMSGFRSTGRDDWQYRQGGRYQKINTAKQQDAFFFYLQWKRKPQDQQKDDDFLANYSLKSSHKFYHNNFHSSVRLVKCWCRNLLQPSPGLLGELSKFTSQTTMGVPALHHPVCPARLWTDSPALSFPSNSPTALGQSVVPRLGLQAGLFPQQCLNLGKTVTLLLSFLKLLIFLAIIPPSLKSTSPSVCRASASCLTSLIYKANRMFLLTHIMLSLLMKKTIPGGQPRGPLKPASKNSSNAQRVRSSKTIFHTMK